MLQNIVVEKISVEEGYIKLEVSRVKGWNPFKKVDMEIGSFIKASPFYKEYDLNEKDNKKDVQDNKNPLDNNGRDS